MLSIEKIHQQLWQMYINSEKADYSAIRPEILESWSYCRGRVDPYKEKNDQFLSKDEFAAVKADHQDLVQIALPVMQKLHSFVQGSDFAIHFAIMVDSSLVHTELIGDQHALRLAHNVNAIPGTAWSEDAMGNNAAAMVVRYKRPFQVLPYENWCYNLQNGTTSGAPIFDPDTGELIAGLMMGAAADHVHLHTLGMVVAAADSIERQLAEHRLRKATEFENQYKTLLMESISDGLIAIDEKDVVTHINSNAKRVFKISEPANGENLYTVLKRSMGNLDGCKGLISIIKAQDEFTDEFINLTSPSGSIRGTVTTRHLRTNEKDKFGKIVIVADMARVNRLTNRTYGQFAHITFNDLVGEDTQFLDCIQVAYQAARGNSTVLLLGESGTGKDLFSQAIHNASTRQNKPYIAINCAAIPRDLLGSELFGYSEGAFTGAKRGGNPGKFELADGGTLFLDEIGEMPLEMQTLLLRIIEDKIVTRIGGKEVIPVDVRIIAATNKDLQTEVEKGTFRADLYYRLNVMTISLPALRQRKDDIPLLAMHFIERISAKLDKEIKYIDPEVIMALTLYDWPGNIRELQNNLERMVNLAKDSRMEANLLPGMIQVKSKTEIDPDNRTLRDYGKSVEQSIIQFYINKNGGNATRAAKEMGISRSTLYRKLEKK